MSKNPSWDYKKNIVNTFIHYRVSEPWYIHSDDWNVTYYTNGKYTNKLRRKKKRGLTPEDVVRVLTDKLRTFCNRTCREYDVNEEGVVGELMRECLYKNYLNFKEHVTDQLVKLDIDPRERRLKILRSFEKIIDEVGARAPIAWQAVNRRKDSYIRLFRSGVTAQSHTQRSAKKKMDGVIIVKV